MVQKDRQKQMLILVDLEVKKELSFMSSFYEDTETNYVFISEEIAFLI